MPTLILKVAPPQSPARERQLAQALTTLTAQLLGKRREVTAVIIESLPAGHWYVGGDAVRRPTALLEISITAGWVLTNCRVWILASGLNRSAKRT